MNYHNIVKDDMLNGEGLRVVLFVSGCEANCIGCQNPQTHPFDSGIKFDNIALSEIIGELKKDYISGFTLCGGEPLHPKNLTTTTLICNTIKEIYPEKTIWCYTGYNFEQVKNLEIIKYIDVLIDGRFIETLKDENYKWAGSTNQRIIDVQKSLKDDKVILWEI